MQQPPKPKPNAMRRRHSGSVKAVLIYVVAIVTAIVAHSIALYLDRAAEDEPRTQASTQRQV